MKGSDCHRAQRPLLGVTIGDPAGIGPEIVARALANPSLHRQARLLAIGTASVMKKALALVGSNLALHPVRHPNEAVFSPAFVDLMEAGSLDFAAIRPGVVQADAGRAAYEYMRLAIELAMANEIDAIVTSPINKEALRAGGAPFLDHTEMLAKLTNSTEPNTLFVAGNLKIFFLTRHVPLIEACRQVTAENVLRALRQADISLCRLGLARRRIAVAGLNPHAGEGGLLGEEDSKEIAPAVSAARSEGIDAWGPIPADSVFFLNQRGSYDAVLALYHDQGHIAAKSFDFERTVSMTLGLPFLRTSVDHGTAFDIAWKGVASSASMEEAIKVAAQYAPHIRQTAADDRSQQSTTFPATFDQA